MAVECMGELPGVGLRSGAARGVGACRRGVGESHVTGPRGAVEEGQEQMCDEGGSITGTAVSVGEGASDVGWGMGEATSGSEGFRK